MEGIFLNIGLQGFGVNKNVFLIGKKSVSV